MSANARTDLCFSCTGPTDSLVVVATRPLTADDAWAPMVPGELQVFVDGAPHPLPAHGP